MPTTEPLDPDDDGEGQLKPIVALSTPPDAPAPAAAPSVRAAQPSASAAPAPARGARLRTTLNTPGLSLTRRRDEDATQPERAGTQRRKTPFGDEAFEAAWQRYINENTTNHLVINTMRAHQAVRFAGTDSFEMVVDSAPQVELMLEAMPHLLEHLRNALANDMITLKVRAAEGVASPMTWNEREVLADITARHPSLREFITALKLTLD